MSLETVYTVEQPTPLLAFLLAHVRGQSRNSVKHMLSRGQVLVDGIPQTRFNLALASGQQVTLLPQARGPALPFPILYEDKGILVIQKPAGLLSVGTDKEKHRTAYRILANHLQSRDCRTRLFVVHRLDRDTSGVLLFTKDEALKNTLQENWNTLVRERRYYAVVEGDDLPDAGACRSRLTENRQHKVYSAKGTVGKEAVTHYQVLARRYGYSLLDVTLDTGRKNQIRAHLSELGHPIAGDEKYGAQSDPMGRLALHAWRLSLTDPRTGKLLSFTASVPSTFQHMFSRYFSK